MYTNDHEHSVEPICFDMTHIEKNLKLIKENFEEYYQKFIEGKDVETLIKNEIEKYNQDREIYLAIMNEENLEIFEEDPEGFKNTILKKKCPIITHIMLYPKAKDYQINFKKANPLELYETFKNLYNFVNTYNEIYENIKDKKISNYNELGMTEIDWEKYAVRKVIGQGIKGYFLYKTNPKYFSNRSTESIWALWYLTGKSEEDCVQGSEFLRLDSVKALTNENYYYPYQLFHFYATKILEFIKEKGLEISEEYRFVIVDAFFNFIVEEHKEEIEFFTKNNEEERYYGY